MFWGKDIVIDLGTANTLVYVKGKGIAVREPSVVAINKSNGEALAVGDNAKSMIGRTPGSIIAIRPLKDGVIADYDITRIMLKYFIGKVTKTSPVSRPRVVVCIPSGVTEVEKRAVEEAVMAAGARTSFLIEEPMAAAIGAGLPVEEPIGSMVVDIGGGTSEVAVVSLGGIVVANSIRVGGDEFDRYITQYIKKQYNLMTGERTAEEIKITIGSEHAYEGEGTMEIRGRDLITGLPKNLTINAQEIREALDEPVTSIIDAVKSTLEKTPPELSADIIDKGIVMTGGGSLLRGLDVLLSEQTGIPVMVAENAFDCVAEGTGRVIDDMDTLHEVLYSSNHK